jgi:hypothetical protein
MWTKPKNPKLSAAPHRIGERIIEVTKELNFDTW